MSDEDRVKVERLLERLESLGGKMPDIRVKVVNYRYAPCVECEFIIRQVWALRGD